MHRSKTVTVITSILAVGAALVASAGFAIAKAEQGRLEDRQVRLEQNLKMQGPRNQDLSADIERLTERIGNLEEDVRSLRSDKVMSLRRDLEQANGCLIEIGQQVTNGFEVSYGWASPYQGLSAPCEEFIDPGLDMD
jgi:septal ring factor EnvC (AmiA/AmiB activator)